MSIHEMINETRLSYGQELLRETEKGLAEISSLCGYTSAAAFSHFFKSRTGQPPRIWRKTAKALCLMAALAQQNILADTIDITRAGIRNDGISDQSHAIERLVSEGKAGTEFVFPAGVYLLNKTVTVSRKTDLAIKGEPGAVLKLHFTPWGPLSENSRAFDFGFCNRLRIEGFTVTTDHPTSCAGRIVAMDPALGTYDVRIADEFPLTGWEHFWGVDTCDESGMPDYALETYEQVTAAEVSDGQGGKRTKMTGTKYRLLSPQLIRVTAPGGSTFDFRRLRLGHRILFRYAIYGSTAFYFGGCSNVVMRNVEIARCASMGVTIAPPSANFTFDNFNIRVPKDSEALYSSNADGIHVFGLAGHLSLDNCHFEGLGDDALNVHANAAKVSAIDPNGRSLSFCGRNGSVPPTNWARPSDHLVVYDRATYRAKGTLTIEAIANGTLTARIPPTLAIVPGDMLANAEHLPCVRIANCSVRNTRARGFLLQSSELEVSRCSFSNIALAGLLVSADFTKWYEAGPTRKALINNCLFDRCSQRKCEANAGSLMISTSHDKPGSSRVPGAHQDIRITGNIFRRFPGYAIFVEAASNVSVCDNTYEGNTRPNPVKFINCENTACLASPRASSSSSHSSKCN